MIKESTAFLAFSEDIRNRSFMDWLEAHISMGAPLHRYKGLLKIDRETLSFYGAEKRTGNEIQLVLFRAEIQEIYHGFDDVFTALETRNLGFGWKPLRITFNREKSDYHVYLIINYSYGRTDNDIWMEILRNWLR